MKERKINVYIMNENENPKDEKERWIKKNERTKNKCLYNEWKGKIQKIKRKANEEEWNKEK